MQKILFIFSLNPFPATRRGETIHNSHFTEKATAPYNEEIACLGLWWVKLSRLQNEH